jgi:hypothetical protein
VVVDPDAPSLVLGVIGESPATVGRAQPLGDQALASAALMLQLAQFGVDVVQRVAAPGASAPAAIRCAGSGTLTLTLDDRDRSGGVSAGDIVSAVMARCGVPVLQRAATGTLRVEVLSGSPAATEPGLSARLSLGDGVVLGAAFGTPYRATTALPEATLLGSLEVRHMASDTAATLRASSSAADDLRMGALLWRKLAVERVVRYDDASITSTASMVLFTGNLGGQVQVSTPQPLTGDLNSQPTSGTLEARAANGRILRVKPLAGVFGFMGHDIVGASGQVLESGRMLWTSDSDALAWDGQRPVGSSYPVAYGGRFDRLVVPEYNGRVSPLDAYQLFGFPPTGSPLGAADVDPIFQRPVLAQPGITQAGTVLRWQLGSALLDEQPTLSFRFVDDDGANDVLSPRGPVAANVSRKGALFLIRPVESLRHGAQYRLQASADGVQWEPATPRTLRRRDGGTVVAEGTLLSFYTPGLLGVNLDRQNTTVLGPDDTTELNVTVDLRLGQSLASVRWTQLSGEPLILDTPAALRTRVRYAAGTPREFGAALVMLTVVDSLGYEERTPVVVRAGDSALNSAALVTFGSLSSLPGRVFRGMAVGPGGVVMNSPSPGLVHLQVQGPLGSRALFLAAPDGAPLALGTYDNASFVSPVPGRPVMSCMVSACQPPSTARFTVLDIAYAPDGSIARLAVDYEQADRGAVVEVNRGSYRWRSAVPVQR